MCQINLICSLPATDKMMSRVIFGRPMNNEDRRAIAAADAWTLYIAKMFAASGQPMELWTDADIDELVETACIRHGADHNRIRWYCENRLTLADWREKDEHALTPSARAQFTRVAARLKECGYESF